MPWRGLVYLALIAPLHVALASLALVIVAIFLPPDKLLQLCLFLPVQAAALWWCVPALAKLTGVGSVSAARLRFRLSATLAGTFFSFLSGLAIATGVATSGEALVLAAAMLICLHTWLIRVDLRD